MAGTGSFTPCLVSSGGSTPSLGDPLVDEYLAFTAARVRPNTLPGVYLHLSNDWLARCPDAGSPGSPRVQWRAGCAVSAVAGSVVVSA